MNNEQIEGIKQQIAFLTRKSTRFETFLLPIFIGEVTAIATKKFLGDQVYLTLCIGGVILAVILIIKISNYDNEIQSLINQFNHESL